MRISMRNRAPLALVLLGMVLLSGCVGQPPVPTGGKGLKISSFAPDFSEIRSGERVTISAMVDNVGEYDATGVSAQLFGLNIGGTEWALSGQSQQTQTVSMIRKSDATLELPGESHQFDWSITSPKDLRVDNTYTANLRVYYKYGTVSNSLVRLMTYDYLKSLPAEQFEEAKASTGVSQSTSSAGPLSVSLNAGNRPLVVYEDKDTFSVQMEIKNADAGNAFDIGAAYPGYPKTATLSSDNLHAVDVDIYTNLGIDCSNTLGAAKRGTIKLTKGETKTLFCTVTVPSKNDLGNTRDYTVTVTLTYGYYIDSSTTVKILKSEAPSGVTPTAPSGETNTVLTMQVSDTTPDINDAITIYGYLVDGDGKKLSVKSIKILKNGVGLTPTVSTDQDGFYEKDYTIKSTDSSFTLEAEFAGDNDYAGSTSGEKTITPTSAISYKPTCEITETPDDDRLYVKADDKTQIFYRSAISYFTVKVSPGTATADVEKVVFPATVSTGGEIKTPSSDGKYALLYNVQTGSDFSASAEATVHYKTGATAKCAFTVNKDNAVPETTIDIDGTGPAGDQSKVDLAFYCADATGGSGCKTTQYCLTLSTSGCTPNSVYEYGKPLRDKTCAKICYVYFKSIDNVGNPEVTKSRSYGPDAPTMPGT